MVGRLEGQVAVVTGAASGIGLATAELFVAEGARVLAADMNAEKGAALAAAHPGKIVFQRTDVAIEAEVAIMLAAAEKAFGRIDCLFNNAGFTRESLTIEELSMADVDQALAVMVRGVLAGIKHVAARLKRQGSGVILSTASVAGMQGGIGGYSYGASKAAIIQITRSAALELAPFNIRVNCLCPGAIATPLFGGAMGLQQAASEKLAHRLEESFKRAQPLPRAGMPEDVAQAALYLAADSGRFVSGHALVIDGALTAGYFDKEGGTAFSKVLTETFDPAKRPKG